MAQASNRQFTSDHIRQPDGRVRFSCSTDNTMFSWLGLGAFDVISVQMMCYYGSIETAKVMGQVEENKWTALTSITWRYMPLDVNGLNIVQGVASAPAGDGSADFFLSFLDKTGSAVLDIRGAGVTFRNRDFEAWRAKNKTRILALPEPSGFVFAEPSAAGVSVEVECFVSPLIDGGAEVPICDALITAKNGFAPAHPYHDGSGDHVNAPHLADAARQFVHLIHPEFGRRQCRSGEMHFTSYVELDRPFRLTLDKSKSSKQRIACDISQGSRVCTTVVFDFDDGDGTA